MNKYQEAFSVIETILHLMCGEKREDGYEPSHDEMSRAMNDFKELVDKATPKKIKVITINGYDWDSMNYVEDKEYCCPTCRNAIGGIGNYCDNCGQKLEGE
mgnify:CR=1 FL=1